MKYILNDLINIFFKYMWIANVLSNKLALHMQIPINTLVWEHTGGYKQRTNVWHLN